MVPLRVLMLLAGGMIAVFGSEHIGYEGAGPLGCVAAAFVSLVCWSRQGWDVEDNPAATAFEIFWMIFEPILFGVTGAQVKFSELEMDVVYFGGGCIVVGALIRILVTVLVGIGCKLNLKEKVFVALSWMAKATVQVSALHSTRVLAGRPSPSPTRHLLDCAGAEKARRDEPGLSAERLAGLGEQEPEVLTAMSASC